MNNAEFVTEAISNNSLGHSNQERRELKILGMRKASNRIHILKSKTVQFGLFRELVGGNPWEVAESPSSELLLNTSG